MTTRWRRLEDTRGRRGGRMTVTATGRVSCNVQCSRVQPRGQSDSGQRYVDRAWLEVKGEEGDCEARAVRRCHEVSLRRSLRRSWDSRAQPQPFPLLFPLLHTLRYRHFSFDFALTRYIAASSSAQDDLLTLSSALSLASLTLSHCLTRRCISASAPSLHHHVSLYPPVLSSLPSRIPFHPFVPSSARSRPSVYSLTAHLSSFPLRSSSLLFFLVVVRPLLLLSALFSLLRSFNRLVL